MSKFLIIAVLLLTIVTPLLAQENEPVILWPPAVYDLSGTVAVTGTVNVTGLRNYFLEAAPYAAEGETVFWTPVSLPRRDAVTEGVLGEWDTSTFPDGLYQLRLRVVLESGESLFYTVTPLRLVNNTERPTSAAPAVIATATPEVQTPPTATVPPPTATIVPPPNPVNELPLPVGGHVTTFNETTVEAMQSAGMTWMKWQVPFVLNEPSLFDVAFDRINFAHANGFKVFLSIKGDKNELAQTGAEDYFPQYAAFVGQVATLQPDAIQVWNEQNLDREWPEGQIDPRSYVDLLSQAYTAIKAADPNVMVVTGAPAPTGAEGAFGLDKVWNDDRYYQGMANAGAADFADCIGVHYNEGIIPPNLQGGDPRQPDYPTRYLPLMIQRAAFPFRQTDVPLCFSEMGYLSPDGYGPLPSSFAWAQNTSVAEQAEWLRDAITIAAQMSSVRVALIIVWNVDFDVYTEDDPQGGYAIIRPDGTCPACETIGSLRDS
ncbi:MAG: hypothetical protein K8L99_05340 [Anaerolineae bacterium]|nr:hypothetical protein [Anaerolineae bacterium]